MNVSTVTAHLSWEEELDKLPCFSVSAQQQLEQEEQQEEQQQQQQQHHHHHHQQQQASTSPHQTCATHILTQNANQSRRIVSTGRIQKATRASSSQLPSHKKNGDIVLTPSTDDVLFGRGHGTNKHPGNKRFRAIVESMKPRYQELRSKTEKKKISHDVLSVIHSYGGRFLLTETDAKTYKPYWVVVSYNDARLKASQALREKKKR